MATIEDFTAVFGEPITYPAEIAGSILKGDNMDLEKMTKTVTVTSVEKKTSESGNVYWRVRTSPVLVPKKAIFLHKEEMVNLLEIDHHYEFEYFINDGGYVQIVTFDETEDINQDMKDDKESSTQSGDSRTNSILLQVGGKIAAVEVKAHNLDEMTNAEIHSYTQSLARSWFTMFKNEGQ